ncbi:MAG: ATP-dependent DNA helicase DinG [Pseudomonadota bacterium]
MLSDDLKKQIQTAYSTLLENKQVKPRIGQRLMIADIARTLGNIEDKVEDGCAANPNIAIIEAGTGTGKTLAYCLASIPIAKSLKKKVIISTATIALQEQIIYKDLPEILNLSPLEFSFTLAKGRRRYICLALLNNYLSKTSAIDQNQMDLGLAEPETSNAHNAENKTTGIKMDLELLAQFSKKLQNKKWNGERDDWPDSIEHAVWFNLTTDFHQCTGRNCSEYDSCIFYKARERVFKSDCIVANHDLVLSDLAMGGGVILPSPAESIYVFDEGHHLPDKAISHFSYSIQLASTRTWLVQLAESLKALLSEASLPTLIKSVVNELPGLATESSDYIQALMDLLNQNIQFTESFDRNKSQPKRTAIHRFQQGIFPLEFHSPIEALKKIFSRIDTILNHISEFCSDILDENRVEISIKMAEYWMQQLQPAISRIESSLALFSHYLVIDDSRNKAPYARWIYQYKQEEADKSDLVLHCCPVLPSQELQSLLWDNCYAAIITSATLSTAGNFNLFKLNSGVDGYFNRINSHFNYRESVNFEVPGMSCDPSTSASEHTDEVGSYLKDNLDTSQGSLVLFSSKKQLNDIEYFLLKDNKKWQDLILTQGKSNKQEIIRQHKKNIDNNQGSIIFGLASFAEGIDLPGKYCTHVIICKLPFSVPDNPVDETLAEWMRAQGRNHFFEVSVPQTTIKLVQACGRLIRHETDQGKITLLDRRILTKRYGREMLNALPDYTMHF